MLACLVFAFGLSDTPRQALEIDRASSLPADAARDAELTVTVLKKGGERVAGAEVRVFWQRDRKYYVAGRGLTDAAGQIHFERLARGVVWVVVHKAKLARTSTQIALGDTPREAHVTLADAHTLEVNVADDEGRPLGEVTVLVQGVDPLPHGALTDDGGRAHLDRLGPAPWQLRVSARGYESVRREVSANTQIVLRRLGGLTVHVQHEDGSAAPGASIVIAGAKLWPARRATTNPKGVASISGLLDGAYDLRAQHGSDVSDTLFGFQLAQGRSESVTLTLHAGRIVTVLVTEGPEADAPVVPSADVVLVEGGLSSFPLRGRTGSDGLVRLGPIAAGPATVGARAEGFVPRGGIAVPEGTNDPVQVGLLRGATLRGEVVDERGFGIDGASIEVVGSDVFGLPVAEAPLLLNFNRLHFAWALTGPVPLIPAGELGVMPGPVPPIPGLSSGFPLSAGDEGAVGSLVDPWVTRENGSFVASPVSPGRVRALVRHPDFVEGLSDAVTLAPGGSATVKVVLFRGGLLEGRVLDHRDFPVAGAQVQLYALSGSYERLALTAEDGTFAFAAVPRQVAVSVARPEDPLTVVLHDIVEVSEDQRAEIELTLPEPRENVEIKVVDEQGRGIDMAQVSVASLDPSAPRRQTLFTPQTGAVTLVDLRGLPIDVTVQAVGWAVRKRRVERAPERLEIELSHGIIVEGEVTSVRGRRYVEAAQVTLVSGGQRMLALTDQAGRYHFDNVPEGKAKVFYEHPDYARASRDAEVVDTGREDRPLELPTVDLVEAATVSGRVLNVDGEPVAGARVGVGFVPAYFAVGSLPEGLTTSNERGEFKLSKVPPGRQIIAAYAPDVGRGQSAPLEIDPDLPESDLEIVLTEPAPAEPPGVGGGVAVTLGERGSKKHPAVVVVHVAPGSHAEQSGLRAGDRLRRIADEAVRDMQSARALLNGPVGSDVVVEVERDGRLLSLELLREQIRR